MKLELLTSGLALTEAARSELSLQGSRPLTLADYATTSGVTLRLEEGVWVNAPLHEHNPNFVVSEPPHLLGYDDGDYWVRSRGIDYQVWPLPVPNYHRQVNSSEERYTTYGITHADRVRLSPILGCGMVCQFCDLPYEQRYRRLRIDGLIDTVDAALRDGALPARHVLISGGTPKAEDFDYVRTVYRSVANAFPEHAVDVMMVPVPGLLDAELLKSEGIAGLAINIEVFNREVAHRLMRQKFDLGIGHYLDFIENAVSVFGVGKVRSLLIVGLEPEEDTLRAVHELAQRGCDPVLSPFRPDPSTPLRNLPPPSPALLERVYQESLEIVEGSGAKLGPRCIPCQHNALAFPDGTVDYYYS